MLRIGRKAQAARQRSNIGLAGVSHPRQKTEYPQRRNSMLKYKLPLVIISALLLSVIASGNAFAYSWSSNDGIEKSRANDFNSPQWRSTISQTISVSNGVTLSWGNEWKNDYSAPLFYKCQWSSGCAGGGSFESSGTLPAYYGVSSTVSMYSGAVNMPYSGYTDTLNNNHLYKDDNPYWKGTDFNTAQRMTRS